MISLTQQQFTTRGLNSGFLCCNGMAQTPNDTRRQHRIISSSSTVLSSTQSNNDARAPVVYPRAAVSVVVRWRAPSNTASMIGTSKVTKTPVQYLLVQRGKEPNKGQWSLPGGKIETGEGTLDAGKRELHEETGLVSSVTDHTRNNIDDEMNEWTLKWHTNGPFSCSDSIHQSDNGENNPLFHYVISQCFAELIASSPPNVDASDDAMDARWWSADEVREAETSGVVTIGVLRVLERSETLYLNGLLECEE